MYVDAHLSLPTAHRGEALSELRMIRRTVYAHGARFARAFRVSRTFRGADALIRPWKSA